MHFGSQVEVENRPKIDVEITSKLDLFLKASWNASWGVGRASTDSDVVQRGTNVAKNPLQGAPGPPPVREKRLPYNTHSPKLSLLVYMLRHALGRWPGEFIKTVDNSYISR